MKEGLELAHDLMLLYKIMKNDIENLRIGNGNSDMLVLFQNHLFHLESLVFSYLKKIKDNCDNLTLEEHTIMKTLIV